MEVLADLPDDSGEGGPQQLLHVVRPRAVLAVRLQVVDPLHAEKDRNEARHSTSQQSAGFSAEVSYTDGGVADVDGVVGVGRVDVELQDLVDVVGLDLQRAQALHHSGLAAQQLKQAGGDKWQRSGRLMWSEYEKI